MRLERQPGQKEPRYAHLLGGPATAETVTQEAVSRAASPPDSPPAFRPESTDRLAELESRLAAVETGLADLRRELGLEPGALEYPGGIQARQPSGEYG